MLRITSMTFNLKFWYILAGRSGNTFRGPPDVFSSVHQRSIMAYVTRRNLAVFRARTADGPSFTSPWTEDTNTEVWLVTNPALYHPLHQREKSKQETEVILWKADIPANSEGHSKFRGIYVMKSAEELKKNFTWNITKLEKCKGGMSLMDFGTLVRAVLVYMRNHYPTTPDEFNFQAELKAASHWYWHLGSEQSLYDEEGHLSSETKHPELILGPHKDLRVKIAALDTCKKRVCDLQELKESPPHLHNLRVEKDEEYSTDEDRKNDLLDDLEESVFDLKTYFSFTDDELTKGQTQIQPPEVPLSSKMAGQSIWNQVIRNPIKILQKGLPMKRNSP